ncbi:MAG: alpha/beta fold hydrolase [Burkholderiales bacterium]
MPYLQLNSDTRIFYEVDDWTDPWTTPESVVMIHGFTECTEAWRAWVPHLGRRYRVIRFDQHGFGKSSAVTSATRFTTDGFVAAAARLITEVGGGSAHVIGAKSGGLIAIELARMRPEVVKTITLASTPLAPPQPQQWLQHMETHGVRSWAQQTMPPRLGSSMSREGSEWWIDLMGRTAIETARAYMQWVSAIDVGATLHEVKCPALVLTTTSPRRAYSRSDVDMYRERLPQAQIVALPGDGYHVGATDPDECARVTLEFLARHSAKGNS